MAPELYRGDNPSKSTDIYAFGIVIYEVVTGARPFGQRGFMELPLLTAEGWRPPRLEDTVAMFGEGTWEFIEKCWDENSEQRPTAGEALEHFKRVAATSTDVNPGPVPSVRGTVVARSSRPDDTSRSFREYLRCYGLDIVSPLTTPLPQVEFFLTTASMIRTGFDRHLSLRVYSLILGAPYLSSLSPPDKPDLLDRMRRGIRSSRPAFLLSSSPRDKA